MSFTFFIAKACFIIFIPLKCFFLDQLIHSFKSSSLYALQIEHISSFCIVRFIPSSCTCNLSWNFVETKLRTKSKRISAKKRALSNKYQVWKVYHQLLYSSDHVGFDEALPIYSLVHSYPR